MLVIAPFLRPPPFHSTKLSFLSIQWLLPTLGWSLCGSCSPGPASALSGGGCRSPNSERFRGVGIWLVSEGSGDWQRDGWPRALLQVSRGWASWQTPGQRLWVRDCFSPQGWEQSSGRFLVCWLLFLLFQICHWKLSAHLVFALNMPMF